MASSTWCRADRYSRASFSSSAWIAATHSNAPPGTSQDKTSLAGHTASRHEHALWRTAMAIDRRTFVGAASAALSGAALSVSSATEGAKRGGSYRRVATEEAFSIPEVAEALRGVARGPGNSLDLYLLRSIYDSSADTPGGKLREALIDLEGARLKEMDANDVAVHLLSLTAPGVQMFDADLAVDLAILANDRLAEVIGRHPTRFAGLASFPPQAPHRAALET